MKISITIVKVFAYLAYHNGIDAIVDKRQNISRRTSIRKASSYSYPSNSSEATHASNNTANPYNDKGYSVSNIGSCDHVSQVPCTATLHDQAGTHTDGVIRIVVDDNTFIFGKRKHDFWKMVAVDESGKHINNKYMSPDKEFDVANWLTATLFSDTSYSVSNIGFCDHVSQTPCTEPSSLPSSLPSFSPSDKSSTCSVSASDGLENSFQLSNGEGDAVFNYQYDVIIGDNSTEIGHVVSCEKSGFLLREIAGIDLEHYVLISNKLVEESIAPYVPSYSPNETCSVHDKSDFSFQVTDDEGEPLVTYLYDVATEENSTTIGRVDLCAKSEFVRSIGGIDLEHYVLFSNQLVEESIAPSVPSYSPNETCSVHDKSDFSFQITDDEGEPLVTYLYDVATEENSTTIGHVDLCAKSEFARNIGGIDLEHYVLISNQLVEESIATS